MPFSVKHIRCRIDPDLDDALFDFQERLGEQFLGAQSVLAELEAIAASVESGILDPGRSDLDQVLALADTSTEEMEDDMGLVISGTTEDVELSIGERYDINVINGRIIPDGDLDISAIQSLTRLSGTISDVLDLIPELSDVVADIGSERSYVGEVEFPPRFILVATHIKTTITPATSCSPEIVVEEEIVAGIEVPISAAAASVGVSEEDLRLYIFWLGPPDAGPRLRARARSLGLTNSQFVDAVSLSSSEDFIVQVINPMDILRLIAVYGEDVDPLLSRVSGPIGLDQRRVLDSILDIFGRSSGAASPAGHRDFSSPAATILSVIDIDKTFDITATLAALGGGDSNLPATQFVAGISAALQSQLFALTLMLSQAQGVLAGVLARLSNLESLVFNIFSDLSNGVFDCLFGAAASGALGFPPVGVPGLGAGSPGIPGVPSVNPLEGLISTIEGQSALVRAFVNSLGDLFGSISSISCMGGFLSGAFSVQGSVPGLACVADTSLGADLDVSLELPASVLDAMGVIKEVMDFISSLFDFAIANLRTLRITATSLGLSLRATLSSRSASPSLGIGGGGCAPPEAVALASALQLRAAAAFTVDVGI